MRGAICCGIMYGVLVTTGLDRKTRINCEHGHGCFGIVIIVGQSVLYQLIAKRVNIANLGAGLDEEIISMMV